jgi:aa3 type cytochrome c oxidase subunit IV
MADHGEVEYATATGNDYAEHEGTYESFVHAAVIGTIFVVNVVVVLGIWGVEGHWLIALGAFIISLVAAAIGAGSASNVPGIISLVLALIALAVF